MAAVDAVRGLADEAASGAGLVVEDVAVQPAGRRRVVRVVVDLPDDAVGGGPVGAAAAGSRWTPWPRCRRPSRSASTTATPWAARRTPSRSARPVSTGR